VSVLKEVFDGESTLTTPQTNTEGKYKHNEDSGTDLKQGSHDINQNYHLDDKANSKCTSTFKMSNATPDGAMPKPIVACFQDFLHAFQTCFEVYQICCAP
jgi:hypothetical protein